MNAKLRNYRTEELMCYNYAATKKYIFKEKQNIIGYRYYKPKFKILKKYFDQRTMKRNKLRNSQNINIITMNF